AAAELIRLLYQRRGPDLGNGITWSFCAAIIDWPSRRLLLVTDRLGSYPLYWFHNSDGCFFASELQALTVIHPAPTVDPNALNDMVHLSFPTARRTLAAGIELLDAACTLTYAIDTATVTIERYASW